MKRTFFALAISLLLISGPGMAGELLFGVTGAGTLVTINLNTGDATPYLDTGLGSWEALDAHEDGLFYAIVNEHRLATINVFTEEIVVVGDLNPVICAEAIAWVDGVLYGSADYTGGCRAETLVTIDPVTAQATPVGPFGSGYVDVDGFAYSPDGTLYATDMNIDPAFRALVTVNRSTGEATPVAEIQQRVIALAFDSSGVLYGATIPSGMGGPSNLVRIDHETGAVTEIGPTGYSNMSGLAFMSLTIAAQETSWSVLKSSFR